MSLLLLVLQRVHGARELRRSEDRDEGLEDRYFRSVGALLLASARACVSGAWRVARGAGILCPGCAWCPVVLQRVSYPLKGLLGRNGVHQQLAQELGEGDGFSEAMARLRVCYH